MFARVLDWIRAHPFRTAVYALLIAAGIVGVVTVTGIANGNRNGLLTRLAQWSPARNWVEREFHVRYSIDDVGIRPECGLRILVRGLKVEVEGAASGSVESATICTQGVDQVGGLHVGPDLISVETARVELPGSIMASQILWRDGAGEMVRANAVTASLSGRSGSVNDLRVAGIASVRSASATLAQSPASAVVVQSADIHGIGDLVVGQQDLAKAGARLQTAAAALVKMGTDTAAFVPQWSATARGLLLRFILIAVTVLLVLKALLTRAPDAVIWRILVVLAPFAAFPLLALTGSWFVIAIAAVAIPIVLWAVAYRRSGQWHQRWEPAAVDVPAVALGLPLLLFWSWPTVALPSLPAIDRVSIAQLNVDGVDATIRQPQCGSGDLARVGVDRAGASQVQVALAGSSLKSLDIDRVFAAGKVVTQGLQPVKFCVTAALRNSGAGPLPEAACASDMLTATAAVDYAALSAGFAADWRGRPQGVSVRGTADLKGARIENLATLAGGPVRIARGSGRVDWPKAIAATFQLHGIEAAGASLDELSANASLPTACTVGPLHVNGRTGNIRYAGAGSDIRVLDANFDFARPTRTSLLANATLNGLSVGGPVSASVPKTSVRLEGSTSSELIPRSLDGRLGFSAGAVDLASPVAFTAELFKGSVNVPHQAITVNQSVTARIPRAVGLELGGSVVVGTNADFHVNVPQLVPALGPADLVLNGLQVDGAWSAGSGFGPLKLASGWNTARFGELPGGISLDQIGRLHLATTGALTETLTFEAPKVNVPAIPRELKFRFEGTPQAITIFPEKGEPIVIDGIDTGGVKAGFAGLKFESLDASTSARVKRAGKEFPVSVLTHITDTATNAELSEPLGARIAATDQAVSFALLRPLDTGKLFDQVGLDLGEIQPKAIVSTLKGQATFAGTRLSGVEVGGALAAGPLAIGKNFDVSQDAAATFLFSAPVFPKAKVTVAAPGLQVALNGGKLKTAVAVDTAADVTLASAPPSPVIDQLIDAANGLIAHVNQGTQVFGEEAGSNFPIGWDLGVDGDGGVLAFTPDGVSFRAKTALRRLDVRQETIDATLDVNAKATVAGDRLLLELQAPGNVGLLGRRFQLTAPLALSLSKKLLPGSGGALFDRSHDVKPADDTIRVAIGYGEALQLATALRLPLFLASSDAVAQAQIRWQAAGASVDSYGTFSFRGLEAGQIGFPNSALEDRLDGDVEFRTQGLVADRKLLPQLLSDASLVGALDHVTFSVKVASAAGNDGLPGITQSSTGLTIKPADELLRLLTQGLNLTFPPGALIYRKLTLDFRVREGVIDPGPVLLTLSGVRLPGVNGLLDSEVRVHWGKNRDVPPPRLRDLIYTVQRVIEP